MASGTAPAAGSDHESSGPSEGLAGRLGPWGLLAIVIGSYYVFYSFFGVTPKYWMSVAKMSGMAFSYHSTVGGMVFAMMIVFALGWHSQLRRNSTRPRIWFGLATAESAITLPSGICTAVVIFTTVYMYTLGAVVVAMVLMRGSLLVIGRVVDKILQIQGIRKQTVYWQSTAAVLFGMAAVLTMVYFAWGPDGKGIFTKPAAIVTMIAYVCAYAVRQYIMASYKERNRGAGYDMVGFFGAEQYWAFMTTLVTAAFVLGAVAVGWDNPKAVNVYKAFRNTDGLAVLSCLPYGLIAFVSVFIFMFEAGSATFNIAINRFTSLMAGFTATIVAHLWLDQRWLKPFELYAFLILTSGFVFLFWAAFRRKREDEAARRAAAA